MSRTGIVSRGIAFLLLWFAAAASAHEIRPAVVTVTFAAQAYQIEISTNVEALLAGVSPKHADTNDSPNALRYNTLRELPPAALKQRFDELAPEFANGLAVEFDGARIAPTLSGIEVPAVGDVKLARISTIRLQGKLPAGVREFRWSYPREYGDNVLRLREQGRAEMASVWLRAGEWSDPYVFGEGIKPRTTAQVAWQYVGLGFTHILPKGLDHILFVLGLFLLSTRWRPLLVQVTSFTIAHSITLALSIYGVFSLPPSIVEPLIALSIAYVAVENILTTELHAWRPFVVFGFGLLHGMGFAGVLREIGMPRSEFLTALITFNVGVELGQLTVISAAYLLVGAWFKDRPWYRRRVVIPASALIAATGLYWTIERTFT
jgi:hypothetical protein